MKYIILSAAAVAATMLLSIPALADSKFAGVEQRSEHRQYHHDDRRADRRDSRHRAQRQYRGRHARDARRDRRVTPFDQNRNWRHPNLASRYRHYDDRYATRDRYRSHYRYGYRYNAGVHLGDCVFLSPRGLTIYYDGRRCD